MKCQRCKRNFPADVISPLVTNSGSEMMCPLCALDARNKIHGLHRETPFRSETASWMYSRAVAHLSNTGQTIADYEKRLSLLHGMDYEGIGD